jgi:CheY-like chemotaxis protein
LEIVRHVLKMYEAELVNSSVEVSVSIDDSYEKLGIQMVLLDPSRLLQVLINLLTNAIKFTQFQARRRIVIYLSASREKPSGAPNGVKFFPINLNRSKTHFSMSMPSDENPVYLMFAVQDSGRGLTENEHKMLFHRFSQANPRTHVQYGGSGLGLFISRELTELQGGQIGVSSAPEQGSTFAFYIKSYKCDASRSGTEEGSIATSAAHAPHLTLPFTTTGLHRIPMLDRSITSPAAPSMIAEAGSTTHPSAAWGTARRPSLIEPILHVLVVEDNVINQRVMAKQLQRAGCVVHVANHGGEALEFLWRSKLVVLERNDSGCDVSADAIVNTTLEATDVVGARRSSHTPATLPVGSEQRQLSGAGIAGKTPEKPSLDVILMDIEMPIMDGLTCVREIRSLQRSRKLWRHVPIICITANAREAQIEEARGVGCVGCSVPTELY